MGKKTVRAGEGRNGGAPPAETRKGMPGRRQGSAKGLSGHKIAQGRGPLVKWNLILKFCALCISHGMATIS